MADTDPPSFARPGEPAVGFSWANPPPNVPMSYAALQRRHDIVKAMMAQRQKSAHPLTQGLFSIGDAIGDIGQMSDFGKKEAAYQADQLAQRKAAADAYGNPAAAQPAAAAATTFNNPQPVPYPVTAKLPFDEASDEPAGSTLDASAPAQAPTRGDTPARFANVRYNNPGAQYPVSGNDADLFDQQGYGVIGGGEKIARFPTPVHGAAANMDLLDRNYTGMPVGAAVAKWSNGGRNTVPGFNPNTVITKDMMRDPSFAIPFTQAIAAGEAPGRYPMSDEQWTAAHNMFTQARGGGAPPPLTGSDAINAALSLANEGGAGNAFAQASPDVLAALTPGGGGAATPAALPPNPPIVRPDITPAPVQVAQAQTGGSAYPPPPAAKLLARPTQPPPTPVSREEQRAVANWMYTDDPTTKGAWGEVAKFYATRRAATDAANNEIFKKQLDQWTTDIDKEQAFKRDFTKEVVTGKIPDPSETAPTTPTGVYDKRLGTPQSPQRSGIPTMDPKPAGIAPEKWRDAQVAEVAKAQQAYEKGVPAGMEALQLIRDVRNHPGKDAGTGPLSAIGGLTGKGLAFQQYVKQLAGKELIEAYQLIRGTGPVGQREGENVAKAIGRLSTFQNKEDFDKALDDLQAVFQASIERVQRKVNQPVTAYRHPGDNSSYAPDKGEQRPGRNGKTYEYVGGNPEVRENWKEVK